MKRSLTEFALVLIAGVLYAIALKYLILPSKVILTGTEGVAAALSYYFDSYRLFILLYLAFQSVLLVFAFLYVSRVFATRTLIAIATVTTVLFLLPELRFAKPEPENERIILVLFGGILAGLAKAIAFRCRGSTGDEDILAAYFAVKYLKPVGYIAILAAVVSTVIGLTLDMLKNGQFEIVVNTLMYTSIYVFVAAETLNNFYRKFKLTRLVIVSRRRDAVANAIVKVSSHRTFTFHQALGGRSGDEFSIVSVIVTCEELPATLEAITQNDPEAFYYHHDVSGVSPRYPMTPIG